MTDFTVVNGTDAQLLNVNAEGDDIDALTYKDNITLSNTELAALCATAGVYVTSNLSGVAAATQIKRVLAIAAHYLSA